MTWGATDLRPVKEQCCNLIDEMNFHHDVVADPERIEQLEELIKAFPVAHYKAMALLKSQLMSGNKPGAKKVIGVLPDVRIHLWLQLVLWPFVVVLRVLGFVWGLLRPIWQFGKLD